MSPQALGEFIEVYRTLRIEAAQAAPAGIAQLPTGRNRAKIVRED